LNFSSEDSIEIKPDDVIEEEKEFDEDIP